MAHETRISTEIEANPDLAAAVRQADGWAAAVIGHPAELQPIIEWSLDRGPAGRPAILLRISAAGSAVERVFSRSELADRGDFEWAVSREWRDVLHLIEQTALGNISRILAEWSKELSVSA